MRDRVQAEAATDGATAVGAGAAESGVGAGSTAGSGPCGSGADGDRDRHDDGGSRSASASMDVSAPPGENTELSGGGHLLATQASSAGTRPQVIQPMGWPPGASVAGSIVQVMPSVER